MLCAMEPLMRSSGRAQGAVDKMVPFARAEFGARGLQTTLGAGLKLVADGLLEHSALFKALTVGPANCIRLAPGRLVVGEVADFVEVDLEASTHFTEEHLVGPSLNSPFLGQTLPGVIHRTWVDGELRYEGLSEEDEA